MTGRGARPQALMLVVGAFLAASCGTLATTGTEVVDASAGVVKSDDGTAVLSYPPDQGDEAPPITIESLDVAPDGDVPGADAAELAGDVLEGLGADPMQLDPDDLRDFELGVWGGWSVSEAWFEEGEDNFGIGSKPLFGPTIELRAPTAWPLRVLPLDVAPSKGQQEAQDETEDEEAAGGTPVPVPIVVRVDEEGVATVLPGTVVTPHPAGTTVTAPLDGPGTVTAFGGGVAVSVVPDRVRALLGEVFSARVALHVADDFGGSLLDHWAVAQGSANVRPLSERVKLAIRDDAGADLEFVCTEPGLGRFGVKLEFNTGEGIDGAFVYPPLLELLFDEEYGWHETALRLGVVECLDPDDPRLPESVIDDLSPVFAGLPRIDDVEPSELPTTEPQDLPRPPVAADGPPSLSGPCDGRAILDDGTVIDPSSSSGVYVVPLTGDAFYEGSVDAVVTEPRGFAGSVDLHLPPPFARVTVGSWAGEGTGTAATGVQAWDLAGTILPPGVRIPLEASHRDDAAGYCSASMVVAFEGGYADSPVGPAGAAAAVLGLGGLAFAGMPRRR